MKPDKLFKDYLNNKFNYFFKALIEDTQLNLIPTKSIELHHGTNTGTNHKVLESFKTEGARSDIASGWGQGYGFYVFTDWLTAASRAMRGRNEDLIRTNMDTNGLPMVVTVREAPMYPEWDIDHELNHQDITEWIRDNQEEIAPHLKNWKIDMDYYNKVKTASKKEKVNRVFFTADSKKRGAPYAFDIHPESSTEDASDLVKFMEEIQQGNKHAVAMFKSIFMANLPKGAAIKYVGKEPLKPVKIMVYKDKNWIQV